MLIGSLPPSLMAPEATNGAALALLAEAEILELAHDDVGEAVVDLGDVDIVVRHAGHGESFGRGLGEPEAGQVRALRDGRGRIGMALGNAEDLRSRAWRSRARAPLTTR